jgi:hypothetical protein
MTTGTSIVKNMICRRAQAVKGGVGAGHHARSPLDSQVDT